MYTYGIHIAYLNIKITYDRFVYNIYINAFSRRFYPKRLTVHSGYTFIVSMCSLGIEPTTFALQTQCSTTEPQEHLYNIYKSLKVTIPKCIL